MIRILGRLFYAIVWTFLPAPKGAKPPVLILLEDDAQGRVKK